MLSRSYHIFHAVLIGFLATKVNSHMLNITRHGFVYDNALNVYVLHDAAYMSDNPHLHDNINITGIAYIYANNSMNGMDPDQMLDFQRLTTADVTIRDELSISEKENSLLNNRKQSLSALSRRDYCVTLPGCMRALGNTDEAFRAFQANSRNAAGFCMGIGGKVWNYVANDNFKNGKAIVKEYVLQFLVEFPTHYLIELMTARKTESSVDNCNDKNEYQIADDFSMMIETRCLAISRARSNQGYVTDIRTSKAAGNGQVVGRALLQKVKVVAKSGGPWQDICHEFGFTF